jgi:hypothetical protein
MPDYKTAGDPLSEKMRLIRFRMKREEVRFADELRLVPQWIWWLMAVLYGIALVATIGANRMGLIEEGGTWPPGHDSFQATLIMAAVVTAIAIPVTCVIALLGYVNQDAKRRGMNSTLWTLLVTMLLPAWLLMGFIIYFLVREPLPYHCTGCGAMVSARFNYCPSCKCNLRPTCQQCKREVGDRDRYCPYCGFEA